MNWITIFLLFALVLQVLGKQSTSSNGVKSKRNSGQRTVRLDPLLRKALLRALTELEREAEEKLRRDEEEKRRSERKDVRKRVNRYEETEEEEEEDISLEEIQRTSDTKYPTPAPIVNSPETEPPYETTTTAAPEITEPPALNEHEFTTVRAHRKKKKGFTSSAKQAIRQEHSRPTFQTERPELTSPAHQTTRAEFTSPAQQTVTQVFTSPAQQTVSQEFTSPAQQTVSQEFTSPAQQTVTQEFTSPAQQTVTQGFTNPAQQTVTQGFTSPAQQTATQGFTSPAQQTVTQGFTSPAQQTVTQGFTSPAQQTVTQGFTSPAIQLTNKPDPTVAPPDVETNFISEQKNKENIIETTEKLEELTTIKPETEAESDGESGKAKSKDGSEVELFKAPLVAAFTLHQDSRGTPHSVVPLIQNLPGQSNQVQNQNFPVQSNQIQNQNFPVQSNQIRNQNFPVQSNQIRNQNFFQQRQQPQQQQQRFVSRPQQLSHQQQFVPRVTITPFSQPNNFNQRQRAFGSTVIPSSTAFPPLSSNSIAASNFQASIIPSQTFELPSTISPPRNLNGFQSTSGSFPASSASFVSSTISFASTPAPFPSSTSPPRNLSPGSTARPLTDFANDVSITQSHVFNLPTPPSELTAPALTAQQTFSTFNIPQVTLPLQNEPRLQFSFQNNQNFVDRQKRVEEQNKQRQVEEFNRLRILDQQKRQQQLQQQRQQLQPAKSAELRQESFGQVQQRPIQRPEPNLEFQRSVGFSFEITPKPPTATQVSFDVQKSRNVAFEDVESRNRVNRQEAFGSTGNFGINKPVNQVSQFQREQTTFQNSQPQFQSQFTNFQPQQYRTIPEEHYRALQQSRFQQFPQVNRFPQNNFQFRQPIQFQQATPQVTRQLENLLFQSGVANGDASRQEDLNIVSKVLALNHERSDVGFLESNRVARNDRTALGKDLLVGEISETPKFVIRN